MFLATAAVGRDISKYSKKKVIFAQGDDADAVFYIKKGKIKVAVISDEGKEAIVALLGADEFVGEGCLIGQPKRLATASAVTECEIMRVEKTFCRSEIFQQLTRVVECPLSLKADSANIRAGTAAVRWT